LIKVAAGCLDNEVVGRQLDVGVGAAVVLLDVGLEVVQVSDRSETWRQCGEGSDLHVVTVVADLSRDVVMRYSHDRRSRLTVWVRDRTLKMAVVCLVLGTPPVLDVVAIAFFALHDPMDGARGAILAIVVEAAPVLSVFTLAVALVDVTASVATALVLVEVGT
jgi:hypothetical protein